MKFIDIILDNSDLKESKLMQAAHKAYDKPDTGITIQHKGAHNVIKDCANITIKYLPHYIFGAYTNPFTSLKGKFKKPDIEEFVKCSRDDYALAQLLIIIMGKIESNNIKSNNIKPIAEKNDIFENDLTIDPYGLYGYGEEEIENEPVNAKMSDVDILCLSFSV
jgi:hypothetical protein